MSIMKPITVLGLSLSLLSLAVTACGSHEDALKAMEDAALKPPSASRQSPAQPEPAASQPSDPAVCEKRNAEVEDLKRRAQKQLEAAFHSGFSGPPVGSPEPLRKDMADIEVRYKGIRCDGETLESVRKQIENTAQE